MKKLTAIFALSTLTLTANASDAWNWDEPQIAAPIEKQVFLKEYVNQGFCWSWDDQPKKALIEVSAVDSYSFE